MPAAADQFYITAKLECEEATKVLRVTFRGAWNEAGEQAISSLGSGEVDPRKLVRYVQRPGGAYLIKRITDRQVCQLGSNNYVVEFTPELAPRFHPEGECATRIGTRATIKLKGHVVAQAGVDGCTESGAVATSITLGPNSAPVYTTEPASRFYGS